MPRQVAAKYRPAPTVALSDRRWPDQQITRAPIWMSTDLRDGNQALIEPMNVARKLRLFEQLLKIGMKEIEVAFPSASQTDFDFVRTLIEDKLIPDDVSIEVLTQSREDLIRRTIASLQGAKRAIVHLYNPIAPAFRRMVFGMSREQVKELALSGTRLIKELTQAIPETEWTFEYTPETFSMAELDFSRDICDAVSAIWNPSPARKMIINLPSTVECNTPNVYADQIEWMHRHLKRRDSIILSVHPHNDRGTAVAAAELAIMAGAERIEGCLFGNGERTGNVDLVTLALNLHSHGVDPKLDFSDIDEVRRCVEYCTDLPVHPRHPYAGELVFTAFSGSHQDAIKKGFAQQAGKRIWEVPYLPVDPADLGRTYDAVIRVNSQSGKGGIAYLLEQDFGLILPRKLQIEFSRIVQQHVDSSGREIKSYEVYALFRHTYLEANQPYEYLSHQISPDPSQANKVQIDITLNVQGKRMHLTGSGNGPIDACVQALGLPITVLDYHEHAMASGANAPAVAYLEMRMAGCETGFGVGIAQNILTASLKAMIAAVNRQLRQTTPAISVETVAVN